MRSANRLIVALLALVIAGAGLLTAAEVLVARTSWPHDPPLVVPYDDWLRYLRPHTWDENVVRLICIGVIVLGVLLIVAAVLGREHRVALRSDSPDIHLSTSRGSLVRALRKDAAKVPGVEAASARIGRRHATVAATVRLADPDAVQEQLRTSLTERLTGMALTTAPGLTVRIKGRRSS